MAIDTAQICLNGHLITKYYKTDPEDRKEFCPKCGSRTIIACEHCNFPFRGQDLDSVVIGIGFEIPGFCEKCGRPYPWTEAKMEAVKELAMEFNINPDDLATLSDSMYNLVADTPRTNISAIRFKKIMTKLGADVYGVGIKILTDVLSEMAKKALVG